MLLSLQGTYYVPRPVFHALSHFIFVTTRWGRGYHEPPTFDCGCKGAQIAPRSGNNPSTRACGWRGTCRTRQAGDRLPSTTDAGSSDPEAAPGTRVQPGYGRQSAQTNHRSVWVTAVSCLPELVAACADLRDEMGKAGPSCPKCWRGLCPVCCGTYSSRPA